ncbi:DUF4865 family protein [Luteibacter yeojuensis]|uniref:DUF4865 family protein n=1 Tax=Luteibacter yeojuensis TaxID=345309 RepID=A0A7X5QWH5_9GAMM|nr:DUF4865 family protein [Luteibacter yeojuensis]NID16705.1 DUF4865 family protein [Luteibacter yeojuensis]
MIAMQYSFTLPADYDMSIVDRRIRDKGPMLDGFPHLRFKAYLVARKEDGAVSSAENLYAPFYLWDEPEGLNDFLTGPGFATLARDFGWPPVRTWMVWHADLAADLATATFASRAIEAIKPHADLAALKTRTVSETRDDVRGGALATVVAFDPTAWTLLRFRLWRDRIPDEGSAGQCYEVRHVSKPHSPAQPL